MREVALLSGGMPSAMGWLRAQVKPGAERITKRRRISGAPEVVVLGTLAREICDVMLGLSGGPVALEKWRTSRSARKPPTSSNYGHRMFSIVPRLNLDIDITLAA